MVPGLHSWSLELSLPLLKGLALGWASFAIMHLLLSCVLF